jgi:hypothetical protein
MLPIQDIIDAATTLSALDYLVLEQDFTALAELESIRVSAQAFRDRFTDISWE